VPFVPLNYRLGDEQLGYLASKHQGAVWVAGDAQADRLAGLGIQARRTGPWLDAIAALAGDAAGACPGGPDEPAAVLYTSGTTAQPKGVLIRHANLLAYVLET